MANKKIKRFDTYSTLSVKLEAECAKFLGNEALLRSCA